MGAKHRYIDRRDWRRVVRKRSTALRLPDGAWAARVEILEVTEPAFGTFTGGSRHCIADAGWCWLSWMRPDFPWALTAARDASGNWVQWYFDIVSGMGEDADGRAWFEDCWLDVVVMPDGRTALLDEDELEAAVRGGEATPEEAAAARRAARDLMAAFPGAQGRLLRGTEELWALFADRDRALCAK